MASLNCKYREPHGNRPWCNCLRKKDSLYCEFENTEFCGYCVKEGELYDPNRIYEIDKKLLEL